MSEPIAEVEKNFTYHAPKPGQPERYQRLREKAKELAYLIYQECPPSRERGTPSNSGTIDCPACNGVKTLRFSRAGYNGHIHAGCTTEGCVRWME
jgi:hypothetical protein